MKKIAALLALILIAGCKPATREAVDPATELPKPPSLASFTEEEKQFLAICLPTLPNFSAAFITAKAKEFGYPTVEDTYSMIGAPRFVSYKDGVYCAFRAPPSARFNVSDDKYLKLVSYIRSRKGGAIRKTTPAFNGKPWYMLVGPDYGIQITADQDGYTLWKD